MRRRLAWGGAGTLVAVVLGVVLVDYDRSLVVEAEGDDFGPPLPFEFLHQPLDHPGLARLRTREGLDGVVAGGRTTIEKLVRLRHWTRRQFDQHQAPDPYPPWDAVKVLDWIRSGKSTGFCAQYAQIFAQSCLAFGWQPRYIEIGPATNPMEHYTTEVWVDELAKWVHLDPTEDVSFETEGRLLSALEVHSALVQGRAAGVVVRGGIAGDEIEGDRRERILSFYYYLRLHRKMNHLSDPLDDFVHPDDMVEWRDRDTVAWETSEVAAPEGVPHVELASVEVWDARLFDFEIDRVHVEVRPRRLRGAVLLDLTNSMPGFDRYRVREDGSPWRDLEGDSFEIALARSKSMTVELIAVNLRGVEGPPARLRLSWSGW